MTNLITLTIPNDDHIALRAFGKALEEMALAHGAEPRNTTVGELTYKLNIDTTEATAALEHLNSAVTEHPHMEVDTTTQQVESLSDKREEFEQIVDDVKVAASEFLNVPSHVLTGQEAPPTTDSTGTPWDERIHSTSKVLNTDGTWRLRRKPKDMDEAQWAAFVEGIKACYEVDNSPVQQVEQPFTCEQQPINLDHVSIDPVHETVELTVEPPVTPPGDDFHTDTDVVTEQTVAGIPPLPVPPPVVVAPSVPEVTEQWDFPRLMTFLTERHGKIDVATVNTLLAQDGMLSVQELNAHPDKIGPFVARVKAHLGE